MSTGKIKVLYDEYYTFTEQIIWYMYRKGFWWITDSEWIDGDSSKGYYATVFGNSFVVWFLRKSKYGVKT